MARPVTAYTGLARDARHDTMANSDEEDRSLLRRDLVDDDDEPALARQCATCRLQAPPTPSSHSLISAKHGWRLQRVAGAAGMEWVCPACWAARRSRVADSDGHAAQSPHPLERPTERERSRSDSAHNVPSASPPIDVRSTGAVDMVSSMCKSLVTKLRTRARAGPQVARLLRAVTELESEIATWAEVPETPERRRELWTELLTRNREADELIASQR